MPPKSVVVGSSNASANGLSYQDDECNGWDEANIYSCNPTLVGEMGTWFDTLWNKKACIIKNEDLTDAYEAWSKRRRQLTFPPRDGRDLLTILTEDPKQYEGRRVYLAVFTEYLGDVEEANVERIKKDEGYAGNMDAFLDWDDLPVDAVLLSVHFDKENGVVEFDDWCEMPKEKELRRDARDKKNYNFYRKLKKNDFPVFKKNKQWDNGVNLLKNDKDKWKKGGAFVDIYEFALKYIK